MLYRAAPWTNEALQHPRVVQELLDAGLEPTGCLVNDLTPERDARLLRGYDEEARADLLAGMGRPFPVMLTPDRTVAVEVSDLHGSPAIRMFTFLQDGALVETQRRWERVPPWPGRLAPFHRFATVDREMARAVAPGRTLDISVGTPARQLEDHRRHVATVSSARGTAPRAYAGMEDVAHGWNTAYAHDQAVARRTDRLIAVVLLAIAVLVVLTPGGRIAGAWAPLAAVVLVLAVWWVFPGLVVLLRRRITWRPAFREGPRGVR